MIIGCIAKICLASFFKDQGIRICSSACETYFLFKIIGPGSGLIPNLQSALFLLVSVFSFGSASFFYLYLTLILVFTPLQLNIFGPNDVMYVDYFLQVSPEVECGLTLGWTASANTTTIGTYLLSTRNTPTLKMQFHQ